MNNQKAFTKPEICFISKKTWKIQAVSKDPAVSDVQWIQKPYFMSKVNTDTRWKRSLAELRISTSEFCLGLWEAEQSAGPANAGGQKSAGSYGGLQLLDSCLYPRPHPALAWVVKEPPLLSRTHRGIQRPLCGGVLAPGVLQTSLPQFQAHGKWVCPLLSPRAWAPSPSYVPGKRIWMESWSLLPKPCPLKQSQEFWNYPHLLLSPMLVITRFTFVGVAKPIQLNNGLSWRCVLVKLRKSSEFRFKKKNI